MEVAGRIFETEETRGEHDFCEPCQAENSKSKADGACRECKEYMCTTCFRSHIKAKQCRNHLLLTLEELSSISLDSSTEDVEICVKHEYERIKFYCRTHDTVGCGDCMVLGHTACTPEYIKDLANSFQKGEEFKNLVARVEMLESYVPENEKTIQKNEEEIELINEDALKGIRQFRLEVNDYLDKAEEHILTEVKKLTAENTKMQSELEQDDKLLASSIEEVKLLDIQMHEGNALFINAVSCKSKLDNIEKMHSEIKQKHKLKRFEFVRDEQISGLLQAVHKFGKLKIDSGFDTKVKPKEFFVGVRVRRGPDWKWGKEDGDGNGTVTRLRSDGWINVKWDEGVQKNYRIGHQNAFDVEIF